MTNSSVQDHTITIKGLTVYYRTAGEPKNPPVVLLNGWGVRVNSFPFNSEKVIREFARHNFYVISPEHPGFMRSETPREIWNFEDYAEYLWELMEKLNISQPIIIGQSFGGAVATAYAGKYSDKIKILVLVSSGLSSDKYLRLFSRFKLYGANFLWVLNKKWVPNLIKKCLVDTALGVPWKYTEKEPFELRLNMWKIFENWKLSNVYSQIKIRTILIWGTQDRIFPLSIAREVLKELPQAELYTILGGHSVLYMRPREIVNLIVSKL